MRFGSPRGLASWIGLAVLAGGAAACGGGERPVVAPRSAAASSESAPPIGRAPHDDRATPPLGGTPVPFVVPRIEEARLPNGVRILVVAQPTMPLVALNVVVDRGAAHAPPGVAAFTARLLEGGTPTRSADTIAAEWERWGASHGSLVDYDHTGIHAHVLAERLPEALALSADLVRRATFPPVEIERARKRITSQLSANRDDPGALSWYAAHETVFGPKHPYGAPALGTEEALRAITRKDLVAFARASFAPDHTTIVLVGAITMDTARALVERSFGDWKGTAKAVAPGPPRAGDASDATSRELPIVIADRPDATQSYVTLVHEGLARREADFAAAMVMGTILGGQFSSRINMNLRERHAYTYGAFAFFSPFRETGLLQVGGAIVKDKTAPAVTELFAELERMRREPVTDEELANAKVYLARSISESFDGQAATARTLVEIVAKGLPLDEYTTWADRIGKVTKDDVLRAAQRYLRPERMRILVVGDAKAISPDLAALHRGPVEVRGRTFDPVR